MQNKNECLFEYKVINAFVNDYNNKYNTNFIYRCRPEKIERSKPSPDFQYDDPIHNKHMFIELKRIPTIDIEIYKNIKDIYKDVKRKMDNYIHGSFLFIIDPACDRISKMPRGKKRDEEIIKIIDVITAKETSLKLEERHKIGVGIDLVKYSNKNSVIMIEPQIKFRTSSEESKNIIDIISELNDKFVSSENNINIVIIFLTTSIAVELVRHINDYDLLFPKKELNFTNINYIFEIEFNDDFDINPLGLSQCYPEGTRGNWFIHSDIFKSKRAYSKIISRYFLGL